MRRRCGILLIAAALAMAPAAAAALDNAQYPDWSGQWVRVGPTNFDPDKPGGLGQQAPLTAEYQAVLEASIAAQKAGGLGNNPTSGCVPPGMPRMMIGLPGGIEFVVTPGLTYVLMGEPTIQIRRIYTDGRPWPRGIEPSFSGYSIGAWSDSNGDGRYDTLSIETRAIRGPRSYDSSGIPFHKDNQTVVKERIALDKDNRNSLVDEITVVDHALTRPWTVRRSYMRDRQPLWIEISCSDNDLQVRLGEELYFKSGEGSLMPTRKNQPLPDLRYFQQPSK
jgi:hypothetical protein